MAKTKTSIAKATDAQAAALANLADAQAGQIVAEHAGMNGLAAFGAMMANADAALRYIVTTAASQIDSTEETLRQAAIVRERAIDG